MCDESLLEFQQVDGPMWRTQTNGLCGMYLVGSKSLPDLQILSAVKPRLVHDTPSVHSTLGRKSPVIDMSALPVRDLCSTAENAPAPQGHNLASSRFTFSLIELLVIYSIVLIKWIEGGLSAHGFKTSYFLGSTIWILKLLPDIK